MKLGLIRRHKSLNCTVYLLAQSQKYTVEMCLEKCFEQKLKAGKIDVFIKCICFKMFRNKGNTQKELYSNDFQEIPVNE